MEHRRCIPSWTLIAGSKTGWAGGGKTTSPSPHSSSSSSNTSSSSSSATFWAQLLRCLAERRMCWSLEDNLPGSCSGPTTIDGNGSTGCAAPIGGGCGGTYRAVPSSIVDQWQAISIAICLSAVLRADIASDEFIEYARLLPPPKTEPGLRRGLVHWPSGGSFPAVPFGEEEWYWVTLVTNAEPPCSKFWKAKAPAPYTWSNSSFPLSTPSLLESNCCTSVSWACRVRIESCRHWMMFGLWKSLRVSGGTASALSFSSLSSRQGRGSNLGISAVLVQNVYKAASGTVNLIQIPRGPINGAETASFPLLNGVLDSDGSWSVSLKHLRVK